MIFNLKSVYRVATGLVGIGALTGLAAWSAGWFEKGQILPGRISEYHKVYDGLWDVACGTAMDGTDRNCYIQYVDVYRPRPEFAAAMVEVVMHQGADGQPDPHVRFDIEPGLSFRDAKVSVEAAEGRVPIDVSGCDTNTCRFSGERGRAILEAWRKGSKLHLEIDEGRAEPARLSWPLENMEIILGDFAAQRAARQLP
jgi:hypothetical protein